jgi:prophage tail gpP-like protein
MAFTDPARAKAGIPLAAIQSLYGDDIAVLKVGAGEFQDWETVFVQIRWGDPFDYARFTAAERKDDTNVTHWQSYQIKPCDNVEVFLAGQRAFQGVVVERQVAYDIDNHGIQFLCKGGAFWRWKTSVNTETGSFDNMNFEAIYKKLMGPKAQVVGTLNPRQFDKLQAQIGESNWDFLERLARVRGIILAGKGEQAVAIGDHYTTPVAMLIEGVNIKSLNCTISIDQSYLEYRIVSQNPPSDDQNGSAANQMVGRWGGQTACPTWVSVNILPAEQPVKSQEELVDRAKNEAKWHEASVIKITAVVQGWRYDNVNLWQVGSSVIVDSPMTGLPPAKFSLQRITFTQDRNSGSQTTLDLVQPWLLGDGKPEVPGLIGQLQPDPQLSMQPPAAPSPDDLNATRPIQ